MATNIYVCCSSMWEEVLAGYPKQAGCIGVNIIGQEDILHKELIDWIKHEESIDKHRWDCCSSIIDCILKSLFHCGTEVVIAYFLSNSLPSDQLFVWRLTVGSDNGGTCQIISNIHPADSLTNLINIWPILTYK